MTDKVKKIRKELARLKEETSIGLSEHENGVEQGRMEIINALSLFLDSLQEEPVSEDLEVAPDKMKEILKHFPDLEEGWKEMEERFKKDPTEREMLSLKYREMLQRESSKESLVESELTKTKRADSDLKVMKANAPKRKFVYPDKLYTRCKDNKTLDISYAPQTLEAVEYVRTDAFIEKVIEYIITHIPDMHTVGIYGAKTDECIIENFRKYMKGE